MSDSFSFSPPPATPPINSIVLCAYCRKLWRYSEPLAYGPGQQRVSFLGPLPDMWTPTLEQATPVAELQGCPSCRPLSTLAFVQPLAPPARPVLLNSTVVPAIADQPTPIHQPARVAVWDLVIDDYRRLGETGKLDTDVETDRIILADMKERDRIGRERYGTPLTTGNGRDHLVDAYQERLDLIVYLRAWLEENKVDEDAPMTPESNRLRSNRFHIRTLYQGALNDLWIHRRLIDEIATEARNAKP